MHSNTSNLPRAARVAGQTKRHYKEPSQPATHVTCATCGYRGEAGTTVGHHVCQQCGNVIVVKGSFPSRTSLWAAYWGDALVVLALSVLAYLLTAMAWHAFLRS